MHVTVEDIQQAQDRLDDKSVVHTTPIETSRSLNEKTSATVYLKMEHPRELIYS